jgi:hypothetical protein
VGAKGLAFCPAGAREVAVLIVAFLELAVLTRAALMLATVIVPSKAKSKAVVGADAALNILAWLLCEKAALTDPYRTQKGWRSGDASPPIRRSG